VAEGVQFWPVVGVDRGNRGVAAFVACRPVQLSEASGRDRPRSSEITVGAPWPVYRDSRLSPLSERSDVKLNRIVGAVAAAIMAGAATVVIGAGPASAALTGTLCIHGTAQCAVPNGSQAVRMVFDPGVDWSWNDVTHPAGQIQQTGTSTCLQLDHQDGNIVIAARCNGATYQKWQTGWGGGGYTFRSTWDSSQCLTYNESKEILDTVACTGAWYQQFAA
jgi:hypothetical protein